MYPLGKQVFISYRSNTEEKVQRAHLLKSALERHALCKHAILFEPEELAVGGEILLPYEFVELMEFITDRLARCDSFVYLETEDYWQSYFTQAEVLQWRRFRKNPFVHAAEIRDDGEGGMSDPVPLEPMTTNEKKLWAKFSVGINRGMQGHLSPAFACGKFAKNCYLVPCRNCGEHFLVSQKAMRQALDGAERLRCPHNGCHAQNFRVREHERRGNFYRKPIVIEQPRHKPLRVLDSWEIMKLIMTNDPLPQFPVITRAGETLRSDLGKVGLLYAGIGAVAGIGLLLASLASDEDG